MPAIKFTLFVPIVAMLCFLCTNEALGAGNPNVRDLNEYCGSPGISCILAGRNIAISSQGITDKQSYLGNEWYLLNQQGAYGTATGCGGSTAYWTLAPKKKEFHGEPGFAKTHNDHIQGSFSTDGTNRGVKKAISTTTPGADLILKCQ